jgi:hypothetical protein
MAGMGLFIAAAGAFFIWFLWKNFDVGQEMDVWIETPCEIVAATIDGSQINQHFETDYEFQVSYRYEFGGETFLSDQVKSKRVSSGDRRKMEKWESQYPTGSIAVCYVNPQEPAEAVLERDTKASIYSIWFPGVFVIGGLGIAISGLLGGRQKKGRR